MMLKMLALQPVHDTAILIEDIIDWRRFTSARQKRKEVQPSPSEQGKSIFDHLFLPACFVKLKFN